MTLLLLTLSLWLQSPPATGTIGGTVVQAETNPLLRVTGARLELTGAGRTLVVESDSFGRFLFSDLPAGQFRLKIRKDGFLREEYPGIVGDGPGLPITLRAGDEVRNIAFELESAPTISGTIRDQGNAPVLGLEVRALKRIFTARGERALGLVASTRTDDLGRYRLYWLDPGEYFVVGLPTASDAGNVFIPVVGAAPTYYPGVTDVDYAKPVQVNSRQTLQGVDFKVAPDRLGGFLGVVESATASRTAPVEVILAAPEDGAGVARFRTKAVIGQEFRLNGIPPGSYILSAFTAEEWGSTRLSLPASFTKPFYLTISPGMLLPGSVERRLTSPANLETARIGLEEMDAALPAPPFTSISADDRFAVAGVQPGNYLLYVEDLPDAVYVQSATFGAVDALSNPIVITGGMLPQEFRIRLADDGGEIRGVVLDGNNQRFTAAQITLVPAENPALLNRYRTTVSDTSGAFRLTGVAPGAYRLYAWRNLRANAHMNAEYMRPYVSVGTTLHIQPESVSTVTLPLLDAPQ